MSLLSCPDGPPCSAGSGNSIAQPNIVFRSITDPTTTTIVQLCREVFTNDFADVFILDINQNRIAKYRKTLVPDSLPALFTYKLPTKTFNLLKNYIGSKITIEAIKYNCITGIQLESDQQSFDLVAE